MPVFRIAFIAALLVGSAVANAAGDSGAAAANDPRNWVAVGRNSSEMHFSPLTEINRDTVARLRLAWSLDLDVGNSQSTPLAVDGVIYVAAGYSQVFAVDAKSGALLWKFDPGVLSLAGRKLRAAAGVRGLAYASGRLFVGTQDGRLIALDMKKGTQAWSTQVLDATDGSFISGAPRVFNGKVVIGFGDPGTVHGFVTAYDAANGQQLWRWVTPGGGGTVWNAMSFDAELNRLYVGTGNARGPYGNALACSVVALNPDSGEKLWQFDAAPGDHTACDDSLDITQVTLAIDGQPRKVILHAPKDGSVYVLDRDSGKVISVRKLGMGAHNHFAQAFSPQTGLLYLPVTDLSGATSDPSVESGTSALLAWDVVKQRSVWAQPTQGAFSGGALATAGDLVFQGQADGHITAYSAGEGRRVWSFYAATAALGTPITFAIGKQQFVSILTGPLAGASASLGASSAKFGWDSRLHPRRLLTFALDAKAELPKTPGPTPVKPLDGPGLAVDDALVSSGAKVYANCSWCHGAGAIAGGAAPDLRAATTPLDAASFATIVRGGLETRAMPKFDELTDLALEGLRHYIRSRARLATRPNGVAPPPEVPKPAEAVKPAEREPDKPPGSLESTGTPPPT